MSNATAPQNMSFCHGIGQYHSPNHPTKPKDLLTIGWGEIVEMANNPGSVQKQEGPWVIPSSLPSRTFREQEADGSFGLLWFDFDENPPLWSAVQNVIREWSSAPFDCVFYHTRSATGDRKKCRVLIPLAVAIHGRTWILVQRIANQKFRDAGIIPDPKNEGAGQLCYLPNKGDFYQPHVEEGRGGFDVLEAFKDELAAMDEAERIKKDQDRERELEREKKRALKRAAGLKMSEERNPITLFNELFTLEDILLGAGYDQSDSDPTQFRHPNSETGNFSASVKDDENGKPRVFTLSSADPLYVPEGSEGRAHDAFSAFEVLFHGGNRNEALKNAADKWIRIGDESLNTVNRREWHKKQIEKIGEHGLLDPSYVAYRAGSVTLSDSVTRFVLLENGSYVADLLRPGWCLNYKDFGASLAASTERVGKSEVPVARLWLSHPDRLTAWGLTFRAGGGRFTKDPDGRECVNIWSREDRVGTIGDPTPFLDHVRFLFGDRADDFLDWLAHIEQRPEVLPHYAWLHVSIPGLGRNWLASVLALVWAGYTATNLDLKAILEGRFNGRLSRKVLAVVDEIKEGGGTNRWANHEKLKALINPELREIKPKYGKERVEFNACRWLIFSNAENALPLERNDRRFDVVLCREKRKSSEEYGRLYALLGDMAFINGVAEFLQTRDISNFDPGRCPEGADKELVRQSSQSEYERIAEEIIEEWPSDIITSHELAREFNKAMDWPTMKKLNSSAITSLKEAGAVALGRDRKIQVTDKQEPCWILRNVTRWELAKTDERREEVLRGKTGLGI